jgi:hypothetical protein
MSFTDMRKNIRVYGSFPVRLRGIDTAGCPFQVGSRVDNISSGGLHMELGRPVAEGSRMFTLVRLAIGAAIAAQGQVTRVEQGPQGLSGVALRFTHTRLLPVQDTGAPSP